MGLMFPGQGPKKRKAAKPAPVGFAFPKPVPRGLLAPRWMQPGGVLKRYTRINPRRVKPRRGPWRSKEHRAAVRTLPCCAPNAPVGCSGRTTASHLDVELTEKGAGMKTGDQNCVPHCWKHGSQWDLRNGPFKGWTKAERAAYATEAIHETLVQLGVRTAA